MTRKKLIYRRPACRSEALRTIDARRAHGLRQLAEAHLATANPEAAVDVLVRSVVLDAPDPALRLTLARAWYHTGAFESALGWLETFRGQAHASAELLRGQILYDLRQYREALAAFARALDADPDLEEARFQRSATLMALSDPAGAMLDLDALLARRPVHPGALMLRATAKLETGAPDSALEDLQAVPEPSQNPEFVLLLARAKLLSGRRETEVEACFTDGMRRYPLDMRLKLACARYLASRRGPDPRAAGRAMSVLKEIADDGSGAAEGPTHTRIQAEALFLMGELSTESAEDREQAEVYFHRGLALLPDDPRGLTGIGVLMLEQGRPSHGLPWLLQSILIDPERPQTLEHLAKALTAVPDDEAVARWIGLVTAGLPGHSPTLLAHLLRFVQEAGRADAYEEVRREGHRMKNLVAVLASRLGPQNGRELDGLYQEWNAFLDRIRSQTPAHTLLSVATLVQIALEQAVPDSSRIRCRLPAGLPLIRGDQSSLSDAIANILRNAVEAYPQADPPPGSIRISARHREDSRWLQVVVTDQGSGIGLDDQRRIFEPGFSRREGGSGLGLAITRRVILAHGGRIAVASAPGGPTTFTVSLPVATRSSTDQLLRYQTLTFQELSAHKENHHAG